MLADRDWRKFFTSHPCDCNMSEPAKDRCNLSGWIRCNRRLREWGQHKALLATGGAR